MFPSELRLFIGFLFLFHAIAVASAVLGAILLLAWAIKHWSAQKLRMVALWLLGAGLIASVVFGMLFFALAGGHRGARGMMQQYQGGMWNQGMMDCDGNFRQGRWMMRGQGDAGVGDTEEGEEYSSSSSESSR